MERPRPTTEMSRREFFGMLGVIIGGAALGFGPADRNQGNLTEEDVKAFALDERSAEIPSPEVPSLHGGSANGDLEFDIKGEPEIQTGDAEVIITITNDLNEPPQP